jgi:glucosylceramidase
MQKNFKQRWFKIIASPWTAPPWMKDNNEWRGWKAVAAIQTIHGLCILVKYFTAYKKHRHKFLGNYCRK